MTLDDLSGKCGYFVNDCHNHCNNGYGCKNVDNDDRSPKNCDIHAYCNAESCPLAYMVDEAGGGGDTIMKLYDQDDTFLKVFGFAISEMERVYSMHRGRKGDTWKDMTPESLRYLFVQEVEEFDSANINSIAEYNELLDVLNVGFMLLTRLSQRGSKE